MSAGLQTASTRAKQAVRDMVETNNGGSSTLQPVLTEILTEIFRAPLKEAVKEAVREVQEDSSTTAGQRRGQKFVYFGLGVALGYLAASGRLPTEEREAIVEEAQNQLPIGPEEDGDQEEREEDESDDEQTQYGGGTQDIDAAEQTDRITDENEGEDDESKDSTDTE